MTGKYMAYGSYFLHGKGKGNHRMMWMLRLKIHLPLRSGGGQFFYLKSSQNGQILYSIADEGVVAFRVASRTESRTFKQCKYQGHARMPSLNKQSRRLYLYLRFPRWKDHGPSSERGRIGRRYRRRRLPQETWLRRGAAASARMSCSRLTPDERFLMVADLGIDQIKVYRFDHKDGKITRGHDPLRARIRPRNISVQLRRRFFMFSMS